MTMIARSVLTIFLTILSGVTSAQIEVTRLLCEKVAPLGNEARSWLLTFDGANVSLTNLSGMSKAPIHYQIERISEDEVLAFRNDSLGRPIQRLILNRITADMKLFDFFYGRDRDTVWNPAKAKMGDFDNDPLVLASDGITKCRKATKQF